MARRDHPARGAQPDGWRDSIGDAMKCEKGMHRVEVAEPFGQTEDRPRRWNVYDCNPILCQCQREKMEEMERLYRTSLEYIGRNKIGQLPPASPAVTAWPEDETVYNMGNGITAKIIHGDPDKPPLNEHPLLRRARERREGDK